MLSLHSNKNLTKTTYKYFVCVYVHMCSWSPFSQKRALDPLELGKQMTLNQWVLGTKSGSSLKATNT